ncbi:MAG TPA: GAF domain-containing protein [Candidatus Binatia bacterium]|nr:GAF domain-containing protein [Candidatus Binatia bacterium]
MKLRLWLERLTNQRMNTSSDTALAEALDSALSVATADCANLQLVHRSRRGLELKAQRGFGQPFLDFFAFVNDGRTACGRALREHRPVVVQDITTSPIFLGTEALEVMLDAGIRAVTSTPLIDDSGEILGVLSVHYRQPHPHMASGLIRLQTLATAVAGLIEGCRPMEPSPSAVSLSLVASK